MPEPQHWSPGQALELETERFKIRSLTPFDADDDYTSWWNDEEIQKGLNSPPRNWDIHRAARHIAQFNNRDSFHLGIFCKQSGKLIGFFALLGNLSQQTARTNVVLGDRDWWNKGVVSEVRTVVMDFAFDLLDVVKIEGEIYGRNLPSIFNYKALGFSAEGVQRSQLKAGDGKGRVDIYRFGLLKEEWLAYKKSKELKP